MASGCAHCGLPLPRRPVQAQVNGVSQHFCCTGCLLVVRITGQTGEAGASHSIFLRLGLSTFFAINVMAFSLPAYFPLLYPFDVSEPGAQAYLLLLRSMALVLSLPVLGLLGAPILWQAIKDLTNGLASVDALIALGSFTAFGLSVWHTATAGPHVYFDTAAMLLVLVALGRYLEARAKAATGSQLSSLLDGLPTNVLKLSPQGVHEVPIASLLPNDRIRVLAGQAFPVDGTVINGTVSVDESSLTGENRPILKERGDTVASGTIPLDGSIEVRVKRVVTDSTAARIAQLLKTAQTERAPAERLAERIAAVFLPCVVLIATGSFFVWLSHAGIESAVLIALSVLVVACPCAFGIAAPVAIWVALSRAAQHGILVRSGAVLERLGQLQRLYLDKTGTLTAGTLRLVRTILAPSCDIDEQTLLQYVSALQQHTPHPLAEAVREAVERTPDLALRDVRYHAGLGLEGWLTDAGQKQHLIVGSQRFIKSQGLCVNEPLTTAARQAETQGATLVFVGWQEHLQALLVFHESLRPETQQAIAQLQTLQLQPEILTGDPIPPASGELLLPVHVGLLPEEKVQRIRESVASGVCVGMVGDGINDAPALAAADVGIALGTHTDLVCEAADIHILEPDLSKLVWVLIYARRVRRTIRGNLGWAFAYNSVALGLAAGGQLNPLLAAVIMLLSSLFILGNTRRLMKN